MRTERQQQASRLNVAKSRGPVTDSGKRKSSANSRSHGLYSTNAPFLQSSEAVSLLPYPEATREQQYQSGTGDPAETALINRAIDALDAFLRIVAAAESILSEEVARQRLIHPEESYDNLLAMAFRRLADETGALHAIDRLEAQAEHRYERALRRLSRYRRKSTNCETNLTTGAHENQIRETNPAPVAQEVKKQE